MTLEQLRKVYIHASEANLLKFIEPLNQTMERYEINNPQRICMFLAQVGHESGELCYVEEIASGQAYEGRKDLGNTSPGDGVRYKGRGLIQITGKVNYLACSLDLDLPLLEEPTLLSQPLYAAMSAGWFWKYKNLNSLCDAGFFKAVTHRVNGGENGYEDRYRLYGLAKAVFMP
jgi:putative chitinase